MLHDNRGIYGIDLTCIAIQHQLRACVNFDAHILADGEAIQVKGNLLIDLEDSFSTGRNIRKQLNDNAIVSGTNRFLQCGIVAVADTGFILLLQRDGLGEEDGDGEGGDVGGEGVALGQVGHKGVGSLISALRRVFVAVPGGHGEGLLPCLGAGQDGGGQVGQDILEEDGMLRIGGQSQHAGIGGEGLEGIHPAPGEDEGILRLGGLFRGRFGGFLRGGLGGGLGGGFRGRFCRSLGGRFRGGLGRSLGHGGAVVLGAHEGAGAGLRAGVIAAGGVVNMGAAQHSGHAAGGLGAAVGTGIGHTAFRVGAALRAVDVGAGGIICIAKIPMLMGAGRSRHCLGIAAIRRMHGMMGIHFRKGRHWHIAHHHAQAQQEGETSA